uniref:DNA polymerase n=1 Tax=viral metagenome TaxID=1070528 RepID=A0A6C0DRU0_9ZZZZ
MINRRFGENIRVLSIYTPKLIKKLKEYVTPYNKQQRNQFKRKHVNKEMVADRKKPSLIIRKDFRLIDFHTYEEEEQTFAVSEENEKKSYKDTLKFMIQMFGVNEKGESCSITIQDYKPFFYVSMGDHWGHSDMHELVFYIKQQLGKRYAESILSADLVEHNKLYGFSAGKKSKFMKLTFKNTVSMNKVKNLWYTYNNDENAEEYRKRRDFIYKNVSIEMYESNIPPLLRYFHINNISPSGWISIPANRVTIPSTKTTTCNYEYVCNISQIKPLPEKETPVPYKICSFDIEASSSHGDFPLPQKTYKRLATNIVDTFIKQDEFLENDVSKAKKLLQKAILSAFGHGKFEDIDIVYPKVMPARDYLNRIIHVLLEKSISAAKKESTEDNSYLLTINEIFERMNNVEEFEGSGDAADNEGGYTGDNDNEDGYKHYYKNKGKKTKINKAATIIDILLSSEYERDEKIRHTDEVMTCLFPQLEGDKVTFIGSTFMKYGEKDTYLNHCIALGNCDDVAGAVIESVDDESDLLLRWAELIQQENPDIIIGYNIFGFDYEFMFRRAQETHCENEFLLLSKKVGDVCGKYKTNTVTGKKELSIENSKMSIASGEYDLRYFKMIGRLQIDMYAYFRRDFNLSSYKLDDVASQFISDDVKKFEHVIHPVYGEVTELYSQNLTGLRKDDFIHIELTSFTSDYYKNGKKFRVLDLEYGRECDGKRYNIVIIDGHEDFDRTKYIKWGTAKDDVTPQDIFRLANGSSADRAVVAKYCIQDCNLVHHLMNKIDVITGYVEMSKICSVPISFLIFRGQGIKLTSYVAKKCREKDTLMPDLEKVSGADGYEGAIVLPPKCSMYMDVPVACVDYSSLYPSSMISQNLSHDSKVWTKEYNLKGELIGETGEKDSKGNFIYDNLPGEHYIDLEFDTFKYLRPTPTSRAIKTKSGKMVCRWAQNKKGIMPAILEELLKARSDTRKMIKTEKDPFMQNILDKRQLGYKVTANSLYGQCGSRTSTFYERDVAASTTATGRMMIVYAKRIIEEVYCDRLYDTAGHGPVLTKAEYIYGDSVSNYTPVYVRVNGEFNICTIDSLSEKYGGGVWTLCSEEGKQDKEFCELNNVETWTERGWTRLYRVIRHKLASHKKMVRILTHTGLVDVTDDHSLLMPNGNEISPKDVTVGTELLHHCLPTQNKNSESEITEDEAKIMGFFFGDGSCGNYDCPTGKKGSWALNNSCPSILNKYHELCQNVYPQFEWVVMDTMESSGVCKISPRCKTHESISEFVRNYRKLMYFEKSKIIPTIIMNGTESVRTAFWEGLYDADGDKDANGYVRIDQKNQISASHIAWLATSLGFKTSLNTRNDKPDIYRITMTKKTQRKNPYSIKKMHEIPYDGYVYDLTTENHHFAAGVGNMIVHNTDSVFFTFNLENPATNEKIRGKDALAITIEIAQDAAKLCTQWLKAPMELSYEKTLMPFILLSKKRYVGMLYETDPNKGKMKFMGLSIKRRDSCDYLKDVYGGILNILMKENNVSSATQYLEKALLDLVDGKVPMDKLTITKALRSDYKNPNQIGHKILANRIGERDPGNKPKPGDRIPFVFVNNPNPKALMGDKIETPEYIIENKLKIDYTHYITNQLMKPLQQLFGLALEQIWEHQNKHRLIKSYRSDMVSLSNEFPDIETFMKKKEKYCSAKIKVLLFDKILTRIQNEKNRVREITSFFKNA